MSVNILIKNSNCIKNLYSVRLIIGKSNRLPNSRVWINFIQLFKTRVYEDFSDYSIDWVFWKEIYYRKFPLTTACQLSRAVLYYRHCLCLASHAFWTLKQFYFGISLNRKLIEGLVITTCRQHSLITACRIVRSLY